MFGSNGSNDTGSNDPGNGSNGPVTHELVISPLDPTVVVTGQPQTFAFSATFDGSALTNGVWSIEDVKLGLIDQTGTFKSQGFMSGSVKVSVRYGNYTASTTLHVQTKIVDNNGNLDSATQTALDNGGTADTNFKWLYPYDKTVFPRNIKSPLLQWGGGTTNGTRVEIGVADFSYVGYFAGSAAAQAQVPDAVWKAAEAAAGGTDDFVVKATKITGQAVTGPISETWHIAQGNLKGSIYYNTYKSASTSTGAVMKLRPGDATATASVMIGQCTVCHSASANGSTIAAGLSWATNNPAASGTFTLSTGNVVTPMFKDTTEKRKTAFAALTPDGTMMITNGVPTTGNWPRGLSGPYSSVLADAATGTTIAAPSFTSQVSYAQSPAFSPDGKHLAFSWGGTGKLGRSLATMDVDWTTTPPTFSTATTLRTVTTGVTAWPSYFPDGAGLVYHEGDRFDTVNGQNGGASYAEVKLIDTADNSVHNLQALNGWLDNGTDSYLPYGSAEENRRNYEPSVLPVPVGGYYWVMFTSRRAYGNTLAPGGTVAGTDNEWGGTVNGVETPSLRKKIWVAAIDLNYHGVGDPSHPAFYLDGQELMAGNMRAYAALDVCHPDGDTCESGADCCTGFCRETSQDADGNPITTCVDQPPGCSQIDETCTTDADCCDVTSGATCINNRCAAPAIF